MLKILRNNIVTVFNGVIVVSVIALLIVHANIDALFLVAVTFFNSSVGIIEELRAKIALDRLRLMHQTKVKVIRENKLCEIAVDNVVLDDVIVFQQGDQIVADGVLVSKNPVQIDESLLTGESDPLKKQEGDLLLSGSFCTSGTGSYKATKVGIDSYINKLTAQAKAYKFMRTPMQKDIDIIVQVLTVFMILFVILLALAGFIKNISLAKNVLAIVTVIKSLVPQGLILVATLAFALGAIRVSKKHILVQKLNAVESMSHLTTLCFDKTGTLSTNQLQFVEIKVLGSDSEKEVIEKLKLFVGAVSDKNRTLIAIEKIFVGVSSEVIAEQPFSSETKCSSVHIRDNDKEMFLWLGAPESFSTEVGVDILKDLRAQGLRVLLFACSDRPLAFVVLRDELRPNLSEAIKFYEERGIKLKILSGDHPDTVIALAKQIGMKVSSDTVMGALVPKQKQQIIKCLQEAGEFVGMIGDGVNDVLALKQADIGVAMNSGSAAARDVADITLLQDEFTHLPALSIEGDRIIYNIKRIAKLFLTKNVYCLFFILFAGFVGLEFPLSPRYITWIDFFTVGVPVALLTLMAPKLQKQSAKHFLIDTTKFALMVGVNIAVIALLVYAGGGKTAAATVIVFLNLYIVFELTKAERGGDAKFLVWTMLIATGLICILFISLPQLRNLIGMVALNLKMWLVVVLAFLIGTISLRLMNKNVAIF